MDLFCLREEIETDTVNNSMFILKLKSLCSFEFYGDVGERCSLMTIFQTELSSE